MNVQAESIKRVAVRGTNWVGDAVMTVPALRALRRVLPTAHITLVIRPGTKGIFAEADFIDDIFFIVIFLIKTDVFVFNLFRRVV